MRTKKLKLFYLIRRLKLLISVNGVKHALKSIAYHNKVMVVIEKDVKYHPNDNMKFDCIVVDESNYKTIQNKFNVKLFDFYANKNVKTLLATKDDEIIGYIRWTQDNNFSDLKKINKKIKSDEAYLFDLWIYPEFRGTEILKWITYETYNYLYTIGIKKYYGYYFSDNIQALWWHRAIVKAQEINKYKAHRFIFIEFINGKFFL